MITSDRPILSITRKEVKEIYWDIQVDGTHNYVTVDGAIHHNSTKTTAGIMKIAYMAKQMARCADGIRRSRAVWVRRSRQMLFDTSIKDFLSWFPEGQAGDFNKTNAQFILRFDDVECEVLFRPMEDESDVNRILSLQLSFAVLDEFREISPAVFEALQGRLGRFPDKRMVLHRPEWGVDEKGNEVAGCVTDEGKPHKHMWGMTNPPDADTYWEKLLTEPPSNVGAFFQPSGMSPEADWVKYLPANYYEDLAQGKSQDYIDVFIHSKFGRTLSGQPVWRCFDRDVHVAKEELKSNAPNLVIGVDAGLNPTAVLTEMTYDGRVLVLDALTGLEGGMSALRFCREMLRPLISSKYPMKTVVIAIDPAAFQRVQTDERSVADIFRQEGFHVMAPVDRSNTLSPRLSVVEKYLTMTVNGNAGMLISPQCKGLISAMGGKYRYKINTKGETDDKPDKNHPFSDYADALQYACLHHDKGSISGRQVGARYQEPEKVDMSAWT